MDMEFFDYCVSRVGGSSGVWGVRFTTLIFTDWTLLIWGYRFVFATFQNNIKDKLGSDTVPSQTRTIPTYVSGVGSCLLYICCLNWHSGISYLTLFIFAHVFLIGLVYDALRLKNTIQVIGLCFFNGALFIYAAIQMDQIKEANDYLESDNRSKRNIWPDIQPFLIAIPCVLGLCTILMSIVAWKLYDEFAWTIYKHISADLRMKRRYLTFQIFVALLKFDFFFFLGFTIQFLVIVLDSSDIEFQLTIVVIPLTIIFLLTAAWATRRELTWLMAIVVVCLIRSNI